MTTTELITLPLAHACGVNPEGCRQETESTNDIVVALLLTGVVYHTPQLKMKECSGDHAYGELFL